MKNIKVTLILVIAIVALRLVIGWHFFKEGAKKFTGPEPFDATPMLAEARGPFAPVFHSFLPDFDGTVRLCIVPSTNEEFQAEVKKREDALAALKAENKKINAENENLPAGKRKKTKQEPVKEVLYYTNGYMIDSGRGVASFKDYLENASGWYKYRTKLSAEEDPAADLAKLVAKEKILSTDQRNAEKVARGDAEMQGIPESEISRLVKEETTEERNKVIAIRAEIAKVKAAIKAKPPTQQKRANTAFLVAAAKLRGQLLINQEDISKYLHGKVRLADNLSDRNTRDVVHQRDRNMKLEREIKGKLRTLKGDMDKIRGDYETALAEIADESQRSWGVYSIGEPGPGPIPMWFINPFVSYFVLIVGFLLMFGLFTRITSIAAAGFLCSVILTQPPGYPGTIETYYQAVELFALLLLAALSAGRFAGLDFLIAAWWEKCPWCAKKKEETPAIETTESSEKITTAEIAS